MIRVVGVGVICGAAHGAGALLDVLDASTASNTKRTTPSNRIEDFDVTKYLDLRGLRPLSRASQLACIAATDALDQADHTGAGVALGTQWGSIDPLIDFNRVVMTQGASRVMPMAFPNVVVNVHAGYVAQFFALSGPNLTLCGVDGGTDAIVEAVAMLELGRSKMMLAGGCEDVGEHSTSEQGEGAAMLLLERVERDQHGVEVTVGVSGEASAAVRSALDGAMPEVVWNCGSEKVLDVSAGVVRHVDDVMGDCRAVNVPAACVAAVESVRRTAGSAVVVSSSGSGVTAIAFRRSS